MNATNLTDELRITDNLKGAVTVFTIDNVDSSKIKIVDNKLWTPKGATVSKVPMESNLVVEVGRNLVARHMFQQLVECDPISYFTVGDGAFLPGDQEVNVDPPPRLGTQTGLVRERFRKQITPAMISFPNTVTGQVQILLGNEEANGFTIDECGLHSFQNTLFATKGIRATPKMDTRAILFIWTVFF